MEKTLGVDMKTDVVTCEVPLGGVLFLNNCIPHKSLENYSDKVQWSLDLRWQRPDKPNGFYDLKSCTLFCSTENPNLAINWEGMANLERSEVEKEDVESDNDLFDTRVHGPWMKRWDITNFNRHTEAMKLSSSWRWRQVKHHD